MAKGLPHAHVHTAALAAVTPITADTVQIGTDADDHFAPGPGTNYMDGGAGNDFLYSGGLNDTLIGGDGNDVLWGEFGVDTMTGGAGADTFEFRAWQETATYDAVSGTWASTPDTITDFQPGVDNIFLDFMQGVDGVRSATVTDNGDGTFDTAFHFENSWTNFTGHITTLGTAPLVSDVVWA